MYRANKDFRRLNTWTKRPQRSFIRTEAEKPKVRRCWRRWRKVWLLATLTEDVKSLEILSTKNEAAKLSAKARSEMTGASEIHEVRNIARWWPSIDDNRTIRRQLDQWRRTGHRESTGSTLDRLWTVHTAGRRTYRRPLWWPSINVDIYSCQTGRLQGTVVTRDAGWELSTVAGDGWWTGRRYRRRQQPTDADRNRRTGHCFVFLHFCVFYYCDISCSCVWQLAFYGNEMNVTIDTGVIVICFVYRLYISECVRHLLLIKKWDEKWMNECRTGLAGVDNDGRPTDWRNLACYRCCGSVGKQNEKVII